METPPVPSPLVKSPPWHIKLGITLWNFEDLYPMPVSPVQRARKFSAVLGTTSAYSSKVMRPSALPAISISKNTDGFFMFRDDLSYLVKCDTEKKVVSQQESMLDTHFFLEMHSDLWLRFSITTICVQLVVHFLENSRGGCSAGNPSSNLAERAERSCADKHGEEKNDLHGSGWNVEWFWCNKYTAS